MIRASAGSGKTYALTNRFIQLLAYGAEPERIVALTFTRKAAGEFFEAIISKLTAAVENEVRAEQVAGEIAVPGLTSADFLKMLKSVIGAMPHLRLGTLDSFYGSIARAFPFELGLAGNFELLPDFERSREQQRVLGSLFASSDEVSGEQMVLLQAFKQATFGTESKRLRPVLELFLQDHHEKFLDVPDASCWGDPQAIWGSTWWDEHPPASADARQLLRGWADEVGLIDRHRERWQDFLEEMAAWRPGVPAGERMLLFFPKIVRLRKELVSRGGIIPFEKTGYPMQPALAAELMGLVAYIYRGEAERMTQVTRGIHRLLRQYDEIYDRLVRRAGRLTFADVQRLLRPGQSAHALGSAEGRERLGYRLDTTVDHWLLDEFQDTSRGQWEILHTMVGEVLQDPVGERSFFCVGDLKQSIYGWRGGDRRLFSEIIALYNRAEPPVIAQQELGQSRRSGPAIIKTVNKVFGDRAVIAQRFSVALAAEWNDSWLEHTTALPDRSGHAAWLHGGPESAADLIVRLLHEIRPLQRGLTCCILTRKNKEAVRLASELRSLGDLPAVAETDAALAADNPYVATLLAALRLAYHPGDRFSRGHVAMTPFGRMLAAEKLETPEALAMRFTAQISSAGFEGWAHYWLERAESGLDPADEFSRKRGRQFLAAAREFDVTGSHDPDEFAEYIASYKLRDDAAGMTIRVMTMHSAKGLDFDLVILPDLKGDTIEALRDGLGVEHDRDHSPKWVLDLPSRWFADEDPVLTDYIMRKKAEAGFEALALLYVAMTRAKRGLYIITPPTGADSASASYQSLLSNSLGRETRPIAIGNSLFMGSWSEGDPQWYKGEFSSGAAGETKESGSVRVQPGAPAMVRRAPRLPSDTNRGRIEAAQLFLAEAKQFSAHGSSVHDLLSEIEWADAAVLSKVEQEWGRRGLPLLGVTEAINALRSSNLASVWKKPKGWRGEVWREKSFEMILDDTWVSGVFDRVVVTYNPAGRPESAVVLDFKTDRLGAATDEALREKYIGQLDVYRRVAAALLRLSPAEISATLIFTSAQRRVSVGMQSG